MKLLRAALVIALALTSGCTFNPVDGQVISNPSAAISFYGISNLSNKPVQIEVLSGGAPLALFPIATTASTVTLTDDGVDYYGWMLSAVIPGSRWVPGTTGSFAKIRTRFIGAAADGSDSFGYTLRPDWSVCHSANPNLGNFITRCKSPRSPNAFLYTSDFPAGADFIIRDMLSPVVSGGRIRVIVRNNGRPGVIGSVECSQLGSASSVSVSAALNPGEERTVDVWVGATNGFNTVRCTVIGTNENGTAEANTTNNTRIQLL